jgi:hypothetical protein
MGLWVRPGALLRIPHGLGRGLGRALRRPGLACGGSSVDLGYRVGVVPERGRAAPTVAEARGGVAQVEAAGQELAGGVMPSALDVELHPGGIRGRSDLVADPVRVPRPGMRRVVGDVFRRGSRDGPTDSGGRLGRLGGVTVGPLPPLGGGERAGQDAVDTADGAGLHRMADVRMAPRPAAVVAGTRPPPAQARITAGLSGNDRGTTMPHDDQTVRGERLQSVPDDPGPDALQGAHLGDRWQFVARDEDPQPDGLGQRCGDLLPGRVPVARVDR